MKSLAALLVLMSLSIPVYADMSAEDKAADDAQNVADAEAAARKKAQEEAFDRQNEALKAKLIKQAEDEGTVNMRKVLGKDAEGKSDAEVRRLYDQRSTQAVQDLTEKEAATRGERDAAMQNMTGKSLEDLENMSDADMDKMAEELEKKYGQ